MVKGFTKCLKIVKLFSITGIVCVCGYDIRDGLWRVDFVQQIFLQPRNSNVEGKFLLCFVQIGHRERLSLWGKHPIDYRDTFLHSAWLEKLRKKLITKVCATEYGPARRGCFPFFAIMAIVLTDRHYWARCNLDQRGTLRVIIRSIAM